MRVNSRDRNFSRPIKTLPALHSTHASLPATSPIFAHANKFRITIRSSTKSVACTSWKRQLNIGLSANPGTNKRISQAWRTDKRPDHLLFETSAAVCFHKHLQSVIPSPSKTSAAPSVFVNICCSVCFHKHLLRVIPSAPKTSAPKTAATPYNGTVWWSRYSFFVHKSRGRSLLSIQSCIPFEVKYSSLLWNHRRSSESE